MIEVIERDDLTANARAMGERFGGHLAEMQDRHPLIGDVRVLGLMIGIELVKDRQSKEHAFEEAEWVVHRALEERLILGRTGPTFPPPRGNVIKFKPAVTIGAADVDAMCEVFDRVLTDAERHFGYAS
jgi:4-aminobutyrate aminotransferase-like enzyme